MLKPHRFTGIVPARTSGDVLSTEGAVIQSTVAQRAAAAINHIHEEVLPRYGVSMTTEKTRSQSPTRQSAQPGRALK